MKLTRRHFLQGLLGGGAALGLWGGSLVWQAHGLSITRYQRPLRDLRAPVRLVFLTDLHYGPFIRATQLRAWVQTAQAQQPELILLGGDYLDIQHHEQLGPLLRELAGLRAPLGVYGVWGNHDYRSLRRTGLSREQLRQTFEQSGVHILRNEGRLLRPDLFVAGIDDLWHGQPDPRSALAGAGSAARLLLSHNPDVLPELPVHADLVLCGHTHGGQIRFPLLGAPFVPSAYGQRYAWGWHQGAHDSPAYVSRGLGVTGLPLRQLCPPELTVLDLIEDRSRVGVTIFGGLKQGMNGSLALDAE